MRATFALFLFLSAALAVTQLRQTDFDEGTYLLTEPGEYVLMEDIVFNPSSVSQLGVSPYEAGDVLRSQMGKYPPSSFGLGFFAAIAISANGAVLDLNGHRIDQHPEHALQQRFYAHIELADRPFIPKQGPHNFGPTINSATNCIIKNGILGLSSHHGFHGNGPTNVTIENIDILHYEVAAIAINGGQNNEIRNVRALGSREDVPVYGTFSSARFIRPYINYLRDSSYDGVLRVGGNDLTIEDIYNNLKSSIENVFEDVVTNSRSTNGRIDEDTHPDEYAVFHNDLGIIDGNSYGILLNKLGLAVHGFPTVPDTSVAENGIVMKDIQIINHVAAIRETVGLRAGPVLENGLPAVIIDPVGSVFQVFNRHPDTEEFITISDSNLDNARYVGNVIANAQAFVGKAILNNAFADSPLDTKRSKFSPEVLNWIEADPSSDEATLGNYIRQGFPPVCNIDSMDHANKGVIGLKIDAAIHVQIDGIQLYNITNFGELGSTICDYSPDEFANDVSTLPGYQGANSRGFSFSGSVDVLVENVKMNHIGSLCGSAIGFDVLLDSHDISIYDTAIDHIKASVEHTREDFFGPNAIPISVGYKAASTSSNVVFEDFSESATLVNNANGIMRLILNESQNGLSSFFSSETTSFDTSIHSESSSSASSVFTSFGIVFFALLAIAL